MYLIKDNAGQFVSMEDGQFVSAVSPWCVSETMRFKSQELAVAKAAALGECQVVWVTDVTLQKFLAFLLEVDEKIEDPQWIALLADTLNTEQLSWQSEAPGVVFWSRRAGDNDLVITVEILLAELTGEHASSLIRNKLNLKKWPIRNEPSNQVNSNH